MWSIAPSDALINDLSYSVRECEELPLFFLFINSLAKCVEMKLYFFVGNILKAVILCKWQCVRLYSQLHVYRNTGTLLSFYLP